MCIRTPVDHGNAPLTDSATQMLGIEEFRLHPSASLRKACLRFKTAYGT